LPVVLSLAPGWLCGGKRAVGNARGFPPATGCTEAFLVRVAVMVVTSLSIHSVPLDIGAEVMTDEET